MEGRPVGPVHHRTPTGSGLSRLFGHLRDPMSWREWAFLVIILPVRCFTWSFTLVWTVLSLSVTYPLWGWALPDPPDNQTLPELIGWHTPGAEYVVYIGIGLFASATLPYFLRGLAVAESSLVWGMLTNETAALRSRADELTRSRQSVVQAEADMLRRVERDIHDGPQQRMVRLTMDLQSAQRRLADDPRSAQPLIEGALAQTQEALAELRALSRGIAPPVLTDRGLAAALAAAAGRCPIPTTLDVSMGASERLPAAVENAAYFVVAEALTNVAKHSDASSANVSVARVADVLHVQISDDGRGGAHIGKGHGLAGLADRLAGVDGALTISSPPAAGTVIDVAIPIPPG
jgi:signal transduction histidine kinase